MTIYECHVDFPRTTQDPDRATAAARRILEAQWRKTIDLYGLLPDTQPTWTQTTHTHTTIDPHTREETHTPCIRIQWVHDTDTPTTPVQSDT